MNVLALPKYEFKKILSKFPDIEEFIKENSRAQKEQNDDRYVIFPSQD